MKIFLLRGGTMFNVNLTISIGIYCEVISSQIIYFISV